MSSTVFTNRFNRTVGVVVVGIAAAIAIGQGISSTRLLLTGLILLSWVTWFAVIFLWMPRLEVNDSAVLIRNPLRSYSVGFGAIIALDTQFSLHIRTAEKRVPVWVAPAPGATGSWRARSQVRGAAGSELPLSQVGATESGYAYTLVHRAWRRKKIDDGAPTSSVTETHWNSGALLSTLAPVVITGVALFLLQ